MRLLFRLARRVRWLREQVAFALGIMLCLVLVVLLLPLVPLFRIYDDIRRLYEAEDE